MDVWILVFQGLWYLLVGVLFASAVFVTLVMIGYYRQSRRERLQRVRTLQNLQQIERYVNGSE